jgi:hypothetical protein
MAATKIRNETLNYSTVRSLATVKSIQSSNIHDTLFEYTEHFN